MSKPDLTSVPVFYHNYVNQITEDNLDKAIELNTISTIELLQSIPGEKWSYRYAEGKWSIKEMIQHIIDGERIFSYRALCFARGEKTSLPGFEENDYADASKADKRSKEALMEEFETVRKSIQQLFASFDEEQLNAVGVANDNPISVNAIGFIIAGHVQHHVNVLNERYL
jgi:hypothetical protein